MIEIRSYRRVFDLERRIYSVDRLRLNPGGVPVRGVVYFLAIAFVSLMLTSVPAIGALAKELPWYLRDIAAPGAGATVLSAIRIEGRVFHLSALALMRCGLASRRLAMGRPCAPPGRRWHPHEIVLLPDGSDGRMRRMRYTGPGAVFVCVEHERGGRAEQRGASGRARPGLRAVLSVQAVPGARVLDRALVVSLSAGSRLLVRPARDRGA